MSDENQTQQPEAQDEQQETQQPEAQDERQPDAEADVDDTDPIDPQPEPEAVVQSEDERRAGIERTIDLIEREVAETLREIDTCNKRIAELRKRRDDLRAELAPARKITQAEAHRQIVESSMRQRMGRAAAVQQFNEMTGGIGTPSVQTPAEIAQRNKR